MNVLLIGSGGREHALAWKLKQSPLLGKLYIAPGNAGTRDLGENVDIPAEDIRQLAQFAERKRIGLTIVGPESPLELGIVDEFRSRNLRIFGPTKAAAQIETSKAFAKALMREAGVPTAEYRSFTDMQTALNYVQLKGSPLVVKASGLMSGKGVHVCRTPEEAESAVRETMQNGEIVIEEYLEGAEISIHALCDGFDFVLFPAAQDHKRALDGDQGKNTGGMGTIAPVSWVTPELMYEIERKAIRPVLDALAFRAAPFTGVLFPGIIVTTSGWKVLEFNARFGDPETQVYMRLLENDLLELLDACVEKKLGSCKLGWKPLHAANIVLASGGYPDTYKTGFKISGLEAAATVPDAVIFHAGTEREEGAIRTAGGRVIGASATGSPLKFALQRAYEAADKIQFEGKYMRRDIGARSM